MRRISLAITLAGIFILLALLNFSRPIPISSPQELSELVDNSLVQTTGKVISERQYQTSKTLKLDNNLEIVCNNCPSQINRTITIVGTIERYQNRTQIQALKITPA